MPTYHVTFFYKLLNQGWTETYYRQSPSGKAACNFSGDGAEFAPWLWWRPQAVKLQAVRAQQVDGLRRMYLRPLTATVGTGPGAPDVASVMAVAYSGFVGGSARRYDFRGLIDGWVKRSLTGKETPNSNLLDAIAGLGDAFDRFGLCGRRIVANPQFRVSGIAPYTGTTELTAVACDNDFEVAPSQFVYFNGPGDVLGLTMRRPYLVAGYEPGTIYIVRTWPDGLAPQSFAGKVRVLEYEYPALKTPRFNRFSRHATGTAYHPASWEPWTDRSIPLHPCGRVVDYLRKGYRTKMRLHRDDPDVLTPVRWFLPEYVKLPEQAPGVIDAPPTFAVPYEHPFASGNWWRKDGYPGPLGEVREVSWEKGQQRVILSAFGLAGTKDDWEDGLTVLSGRPGFDYPTNKPCGCGPGVLAVSGGGSSGGRAEVNIPTVTTCSSFPEIAATWSVKLSGVTNGYCSGCDAMNGLHILTYTGAGCGWAKLGIPACGAVIFAELHLFIDSFGNVFFQAYRYPYFYTVWRMFATDFDPLGENTIPFDYDNLPFCDNLPATVTVKPLSGA